MVGTVHDASFCRQVSAVDPWHRKTRATVQRTHCRQRVGPLVSATNTLIGNVLKKDGKFKPKDALRCPKANAQIFRPTPGPTVIRSRSIQVIHSPSVSANDSSFRS